MPDAAMNEVTSLPDSPDDPRREALLEWLSAGLEVDRMETASGDASFRRYFRVFSDGRQYIAMDAPPSKESTGPFVRIAGMLRAMGLNAPEVLAADPESGFLLLTDLGSRQYLAELREYPGHAAGLYDDALAALDTLQHAGREYQSQLPPYDSALLTAELGLFRDWLVGTHLGLEWSAEDEDAWRLTCDFLVESALAQPRVFVHRDYHSRNLMVRETGNPGILDFQDAVCGPLTYDLVSLLRDCYVRLPGADVRRRALDFFERCRPRLPTAFDETAFLRAFDLTGVQRHLKAAGIFARLNHRDGKPGYLDDVPRTLRYVAEVAPRYRELSFLAEVVERRCLPALERR